MVSDDYSPVADEQLDDMEVHAEPAHYNAVLDACELIFELPSQAQQHSTAIMTGDGVRLVLPVPGYLTRVYWSSGPPPRIEAVFPM